MGRNNLLRRIQASTLVGKLEQAKRQGQSVFVLRDTIVVGTLDLRNRTVEVAMDIQNCHFRGGVDLRYCEFKQAVKLCNCTFLKPFNSGDDTDSRTIYRKNLICNDTVFVEVAYFRGLQCEGYALFRSARFLRTEPLRDKAYGSLLERPPVDFTGSSFSGGMDFTRASFDGGVSFNLVDGTVATFKATQFLRKDPLEDETHKGGLQTPPVDFTASSFKSLECDGARFLGAVSFRGIECAARASFQETRFEQHELLRDKIGTLASEVERTVPVDFTNSSFGYLNALGATFNGATSFNGVRCTGDAVFKDAHFLWLEREDLPDEQLSECNIGFKYSDYRSSLIFHHARFERPVTLKETRISDTLNLNRATFCENASFYGAKAGRLRFRNPWFEPHSADLREFSFESHTGFELRDFRDNGKPHAVLAQIVDCKKFSMDPYLQLEQKYIRSGDENKARAVYREGRRHSRKNARMVFRLKRRASKEAVEPEHNEDVWPWSRKLSDFALDHLTGYGLRIGRLFLAAAIVLVLGFVIFLPPNALVQVDASSSSSVPSRTFLTSIASVEEPSTYSLWDRGWDRAMYSLDLFLPVVKLGADDLWKPNNLAVQRYAFVHQFIGWLVVPLLLASLAGIFKR
jgi:uncharacterized protein YjbI with pentapeptide repeats